MIPSTTYSAPLTSKKEGFPLRPLSANLSSPTSALAQRRNRNNKNLSLCLTPSSTTTNASHTNLDINHLIPPSTPFTPFKSKSSTKYYEHGPICILPGIYLGDESNALNETQLKLYNIHYIMNVATEVNHPNLNSFQKWENNNEQQQNEFLLLPCPTLSSSSSSTNSSHSFSSHEDDEVSSSTTNNNQPIIIKYKKRSWHHQIKDNDQLSLKELHEAVMDIVQVKKEFKHQNILIHCQCGLARSASVIIAYMMYTRQLTMQLAIIEVKKQAPHINPNFSLMYHLREYERYLMIQQAITTNHTSSTTTSTTSTSPNDMITADNNRKSIHHSSSSNDTIKSSHSSFVAKWKNFKYKSIYRHQWWRHSTNSSTSTPNHPLNNTIVTTSN